MKKTAAERAAEKLTAKERAFVREFLKDWNGTQAAIRAGYSAGRDNQSAATAASRLRHDKRVNAYLDALIDESAAGREVSRESVILRTLDIYRRCTAAEPVMIWDAARKEYVESGVWKFDAKGATRALELLSKMLGYDAPVKIADADGERLTLALGVRDDAG